MGAEDELSRFDRWERSSWEGSAEAYAGSIGVLTGGSIDALLRAAHVGRGTRVLDVGTGPGFVAAAATKRLARVTAVDQSAAMARIARASGAQTVQAGAGALPFHDGTFQAVVAGYLVNHLAHPEAAIDELARVLGPRGRLAFTVWDEPAANPATGLFGPVIAELGLTSAAPTGPDPQRFAEEPAVRRLLVRWDDVSVTRLRWSIRVDPGTWFDAIADATPRTGAVLAQASPSLRAAARDRYVRLATERYGGSDALVVLPAGAVLVAATSR